jgi:integrase
VRPARGGRVELEDLWTPAELGRFLEFAKLHGMSAFFHVAAFTGARRGELLNLTWPMVDLTGGVVVITGWASLGFGTRPSSAGGDLAVNYGSEVLRVPGPPRAAWRFAQTAMAGHLHHRRQTGP